VAAMAELIIISNRLPVSVRKSGNDIEVYPSAGGLATGLSSYTKRRGTKWIGWPGLPSNALTEADRLQIADKLREYHCYPVFLSRKQINEFYNGYSNGVLWPLFHDLPAHSGDSEKNWQTYQAVNHTFADVALGLSKPGSTLWVHDYQLLLTPQYLRVERPNDRIGFFLHIPFPEANTFTGLPHAANLLAGTLGADLVGLHTDGYAKHFLQSCRQLELGDVAGDQAILPTHTVRVTDFPMGIDYLKFAHAARLRRVQVEHRSLERTYRGQKLILTVDRLDPAKGLLERLEAYEQLLSSDPHLHEAITMLMLVIPSREEVPEYQELKQRIERTVGRINDRFATRYWQPIDYLYQTVPFEQLTAMYQRADIAFVAPIRDGMNLVAKEYIASQQGHRGILVLSETAGAAEELKEAIQVDPTRPKSLVGGLRRALTLPRGDLRRRADTMRRHLRHFTVQRWADSFMEELQQAPTSAASRTYTLDDIHRQKVIDAYHKAKRRLLLLDYDGVLRSFERKPDAAEPSHELMALLKHLGQNVANDVVIISGRSKTDLNNWFGTLPIALAAEHGALFRRKGGHNWHKTTSSESGWRHPVSVLFKTYAERIPDVTVEQKEWAVVWHYRAASPYQARRLLVRLRYTLKPIIKEYNLQVLEGNKVLEVRPADVTKGRVAQEWIIHDYDFVLAIGDDTTDEDMFAAVPPGGYTIKVGRGPTLARFRLPDVPAVLRLLSEF